MRVVAGRLRGRALVAPADVRVRPTADRVRQAVFDILTHGVDGFSLDGTDVLDLFAGTGAMGIEALSRGARSAVLVEQDADARGLIRENLDNLGLNGAAKMFRRDATDLGPAQRQGPFGLVLLDPPYGQGLGEKALAAARDGGWLALGAVAVLEERADAELALPLDGFTEFDRRTWGITQSVFLRFAGEAPHA
jgi:16S rRNA (guanine966-N2)-methyltransferase